MAENQKVSFEFDSSRRVIQYLKENGVSHNQAQLF